MQLYCSLSGGVSSRSSAYVGRNLQVAGQNGRCLPASASCVVGVRSEKADLWQLLGGRGLPGGEEVLKNESKSNVLFGGVKEQAPQEKSGGPASEESASDDEDAAAAGFEKEMMGLTGGFPGGETGLQRFIATSTPVLPQHGAVLPPPQLRPRAPAPPLLMPGMTVIVKNPHNPFYMYSGIVQRVSDGRVGVLFEGGNWDKLLTFYLEDLERTLTGPPMINPKSAILLQRPPPPPAPPR